MKYSNLILLLSFLCLNLTSAQDNSPLFKKIETAFKVDKNKVLWQYYSEQTLKGEHPYKVIAFPLIKETNYGSKNLFSTYLLVYNPEKDAFIYTFIGDGDLHETPTKHFQGFEVMPNTLMLNKKTTALQVKLFFSNFNRKTPTGEALIEWYIPKGKKLRKVLSTPVSHYEGKVVSTPSQPCGGTMEERSAHIALTEQLVKGFFTVQITTTIEHKAIVPDTEGCTEKLLSTDTVTEEWHYTKKGYTP
ncbi:hypothetical protein SAMN05444369_1037 [Capnocytophaga haemolytica]|jgi:hypothetical protein|uniref:GLPGLI family protein n=1 Tax=Capnocytophaga haemolytica TaxID=45243 RepID=A0AAX2H273_9FLAO|nr:hypothetical protein [Capnocytophaga haemolytica]AMD85844.1 hypothetical protein AXF12_10170 [Capnocytophaga haemolytica]SFN80612.1 hypothetical protein SAMN05444369_1037 [Capnocytophaga haemolytica]SNV15621.1 Uncharacterised protein [Capnocytophaga haemolytica]